MSLLMPENSAIRWWKLPRLPGKIGNFSFLREIKWQFLWLIVLAKVGMDHDVLLQWNLPDQDPCLNCP
jgi:hypothetical protein